MLLKGLKDKGSVFKVCICDWEAYVLSESSVDAATEALENLYGEHGGNLVLSPAIKTTNLSFALKDYELDILEEYHYTPEILSNAGLHELAKKMKTIMDIQDPLPNNE
tara:strand:- start:30 stop:353 length:324 start_codon:yes stop_codon:yes gene_type:complete